MKILHLTIHKFWFDMILSGEKIEEYRMIKPYWDKRLSKKYDAILFRNGYKTNSRSMLVELEEIKKGLGWEDWGAPTIEVYILKLGNVIDHGKQLDGSPCGEVVK